MKSGTCSKEIMRAAGSYTRYKIVHEVKTTESGDENFLFSLPLYVTEIFHNKRIFKKSAQISFLGLWTI